MPESLQLVVERMVTAGEAEENIALVIQHYKAQPATHGAPAPTGGMSVIEMGRRTNQQEGEPGAISSFVQSDLAQGAAHPKTMGDILQFVLGPVDATRGVGMKVAGTALSKLPSVSGLIRSGRSAASSTIGAVGEALDSTVAGAISPRAPYLGKMAKGAAKIIAPAEKVAPVSNATWTQAASPTVASPPTAAVTAPIAEAATPAAAAVPKTAMSPQRILNDLAIQARRANITLTPDDYAQASELVAKGQSAAEVVQSIGTPIPVVAAGQATGQALTTAAKAKVKLTVAEVSAARDMIRHGMEPEAALDAIVKIRQLPDAFRALPTDVEVRSALDLRNARGQLKTPSAQTARDRKAMVK